MALIERAFREKIVLVGVTIPPETVEETENSVDELALLVDTAGADEVGRIFQRRSAPDPPTYVGKGKAEELRELALATDCDTVVFDNELTPAMRLLPERFGVELVDAFAVRRRLPWLHVNLVTAFLAASVRFWSGIDVGSSLRAKSARNVAASSSG